MLNYVVVLLLTIVFKPKQHFKIANRLMNAKMTF